MKVCVSGALGEHKEWSDQMTGFSFGSGMERVPSCVTPWNRLFCFKIPLLNKALWRGLKDKHPFWHSQLCMLCVCAKKKTKPTMHIYSAYIIADFRVFSMLIHPEYIETEFKNKTGEKGVGKMKGKGHCCQVQWPEFDSLKPICIMREQVLTSCFLTSPHTKVNVT